MKNNDLQSYLRDGALENLDTNKTLHVDPPNVNLL